MFNGVPGRRCFHPMDEDLVHRDPILGSRQLQGLLPGYRIGAAENERSSGYVLVQTRNRSMAAISVLWLLVALGNCRKSQILGR